MKFRLSLCFLLLFACGCSSIIDSRKQKKEIMAQYVEGDFKDAAELATEKAKDRAGTGDDLMWRLEEGSAEFAAGNYKQSIKAFEHAEAVLKDFDNRAEINVREAGAEVGAVVTNLNALPYRSNYVEIILLNAYKALDYFALGDASGARVELRRMYYNQKKSMERFQEEIDKVNKEVEEKKYDREKVISGIKEIKSINESITKNSNKAYANYVNPFATYLSAIGYLTDHDYNGAEVDLRNIYKMNPANPLIQRDYVTCARKIGSDLPKELQKITPYPYPLDNDIVFVILANGLIAAKKGITIHLLLPPPVTGYTGVAFPILEYFPKPVNSLEISADGKTEKTVAVAEMDPAVTEQYKQALPLMIFRIFLSVAAKEVANYFILEAIRKKMREADRRGDHNAYRNHQFAYWSAVAGMSTYKYLFNTADTRCWQMLPKEYQIAHMPRPKDGKLQIKTLGGHGSSEFHEVTLDKSKKMSIVYVNCPGPGVCSIKVFNF